MFIYLYLVKLVTHLADRQPATSAIDASLSIFSFWGSVVKEVGARLLEEGTSGSTIPHHPPQPDESTATSLLFIICNT